MDDKNIKRGFSGLSDLVSVVSGAEKPVKSEVTAEDAKPPTPEQHSQPNRKVAPQQSKTDSTAPLVDSASAGKNPSSSIGKWFFVIAGFVLVIWFIENTGQSKKLPLNGSTSQSYNVPQSTPTTAKIVSSASQNTRLHYAKPSVGTNNILTVPQIRWCIREDIRIDAMREVSGSNEGIGQFNRIVDEFNSRCGSYRYSQGSQSRAKREVEPYRSQIVAEAVRDAKRYSTVDKLPSSSISLSNSFSGASETSSAQYTLQAQQLLTNLGYSPGPIDGDYGRKTASAVKDFQLAQGLAIDGVISKFLMDQLRLAVDSRTTNQISSVEATSKLTLKDTSRTFEANLSGMPSTCENLDSSTNIDSCQEEESSSSNQIEVNPDSPELIALGAQRQQRELVRLRTSYFNTIRQRVERNWVKPLSYTGYVNCTVSVLQSPVGEILNVKVDVCDGNNAALRQSVENAVWAASPLPSVPDPKLFDRRVRFFFKPR